MKNQQPEGAFVDSVLIDRKCCVQYQWAGDTDIQM